MDFKGIIADWVREKFEIPARKNKNNRGSARFIWFLLKKSVILYGKLSTMLYDLLYQIGFYRVFLLSGNKFDRTKLSERHTVLFWIFEGIKRNVVGKKNTIFLSSCVLFSNKN